MWRGNHFRSGISLAVVGAVVATISCSDDPSSISRNPNRGGSSGAAGAGGSVSGTGGVVSGGTSGTGGSVGGTGGASGGAAGSAGSAGTAGTGAEGGEGGDGMGGEGGEAGTMMGGMGGMGGAGMGGMPGGTGGAGAGGAGAGGAGAGGKAGAGGAGAGGGGAGGAGAGGGGAGGKAGAGGAGAGGAGAGGAGAGGGGAGGAGGAGGSGGMQMAPNLYFTEYVEGGTTVADAFEVFNATGGPYNLAGCEIRVHYAAAAGSTAVTLSGTLAANDVYVLCLGNISFACDAVTAGLMNLSGDDAVELVCPVGNVPTPLDIIGAYGMGQDPGAQWGMGATATSTVTLRRNCNVTIGERNATNAFTPGTQWTGRDEGNIAGLGGRLCPCTMANQNICP
jgi:hypothetical protein